MKKVLLKNETGFVHHLIFIALFVGILGLLVFTGSRVWVKTKEPAAKPASNTPSAAAQVAVTETSTPTIAPTPSTTVVHKKGTAAASIPVTATSTTPVVKEQVPIKTDQNVKTPQGSFYQLIFELRAKNYVNALYFISPDFLEQSADILKLVGNVTVDDCKQNPACNVLLNTPLPALDSSVVSTYIKSATISGKSLVYEVQLPGGLYPGQENTGDGMYRITVDMVDASTNWVVDRITIEGHTL